MNFFLLLPFDVNAWHKRLAYDTMIHTLDRLISILKCCSNRYSIKHAKRSYLARATTLFVLYRVSFLLCLICHFRITGLDPANPPFFPAILLDHLSHRDAEFVDIIHTDAGLYGQPYSTGTADFWPNDGNVEKAKNILHCNIEVCVQKKMK